MRTILSLILILTLLSDGAFIATAAEDTTALGTYQNYQDNVNKYCKLEGNPPNKADLWYEWKNKSLVRFEEVLYADITKDTTDAKYKEYLNTIKADPSRIDIIGLTTPKPNFIEKSAYVYSETMGTIYACAVLNAKIRVTKSLLEKIPTPQSNIKNELKRLIKVAQNELKRRECRDIASKSEGEELSIKKQLLDNTMYQYCNYRYYLYYLSYASKNSLDQYFQTKDANGSGSSLLKNTDSAAAYIQSQSNRIDNEIAHVKEIFPQALVAYTEFERTYAEHIMLVFILQDYIGIRDTLKHLLNPIGQVIYKASNAQSPGK